MAKKFDPMDEAKNALESKAKGAVKTALKAIMLKLSLIVLKLLPMLIVGILVGTIVFNLLNYAKEFIQGIFTQDAVLEVLETENISSLVEIKGNSQEGYYWGFVNDIDTKLDAVIKRLTNDVNTVTIKDKVLLKKMIKAEIVTQYPDLGGKTFSSDNTYSGSSEERAKQILEDMSLDEKISQMLFLITNNGDDLSKNAGGYILSDDFDFSNVKSIVESANNNVKPVIATEEEGGNGGTLSDARSYGENKAYSKLEEDFTNVSKELLEKGINMNLAPVADVSKEGSYIGRRSFSDDYEVATECVKRAVKSMKSAGLMTTLKHYPGYADATSDNYTDERSVDEIQQDINVFREGIKEGASTVTVSHFKVDALDSDNPASLSKNVINSIRNLGFNGVIMTDSMDLGAVNNIDDRYVKAIKAGNDVLEVTDFEGAKQQILDAVSRDDISVEQINESVTRILTMKFEYGVIEINEEDEVDPDEVKIQDTENNFQGAIHLRRVMPDKELAELKNVSTGVPVEKYKYVNTDNVGLGTKEKIPDSVKEKMEGSSMNGLYGTTYDDLSYLTIPYYNLKGEVKLGHLIVNKDLEDEVLLIFQELYKSKVKINSMDIVDDLSSSVDSIDLGDDENNISYAMKLDRASKYYNNTSGFNDRAGYDGEESAHAKGYAIDINPLVNPYVSDGTYYPTNAEKYTNRNNSNFSEKEKEQLITTESDVYKIFQKYGWTWGGESDGGRDYSHFEKKEISEIIKITNTQVQIENNNSEESGETAGDGKQYIVALAAGHNNVNDTGATGVTQDGTVLREEDLTVKVAEFAEQMLSKYTNIKVVQTGSTSDNRGTVQISDRVRLAQEANADLCIQIHLNSTDEGESSGSSNYATTIYKSGDTESGKLSDCVLSALSSAMGIKAGVPLVDGENYNRNLSIIANSSECGFPNIVTEGAFINNPENQELLSTDEGLKKYAQGIVDGILEYLDVANTGYGETGTSNTTGATEVNSGIRSKIFDLKYVPLDQFREEIKNNNQNAIREFTIDENGKILVATWSYSDTGEGLKLSEKAFNTASSYTQKYTMPLEYLIAFYIDTRNKEFVSDLAELAMDSEFVLAVQDNVKTTKTEERETVDYNTVTYPGNGGQVTYDSWSQGERLLSSNISETVSTTIELTYGDTWFMEFYKDINYSSSNLSNIMAESVGTEVGEQGTYLGDFYLTAYCKWCNSPPGSLETSSGNSAQPNRTIAVHSEYFNGQAKNGALSNGSKVVINGQVYTVEDTGDYSRSRPDDWVDIFIDGGDTQPSSSSNDPCNTAQFSGSTVPVYVAENVRPVSESGSVSDVATTKRVDTKAIIQGNVTIQDYDTVQTSTSTSVLYDTDRTKYVTTTTRTNVTSVESYGYKYETGEMHVVGNEQKFITIYNKNNEFKSALKPTWLYKVLSKQERTSTMIDLTKYLIYRANGQIESYDGITSFDFNQYAPQDFNQIKSNSGLSLTDTIFTKEVFKEALQAYYDKTNNQAFYDNFLSKADELYDTAVANNVNPELVVITAKTEGQFRETGGSYNYWGIAVDNGATKGSSFSSFEEAIKGYATVIQSCMPGGSQESVVWQRYEERKDTGCDPNGYGEPGTLSGMQSVYSYLGKHGQAYSGSGAGGYYYMDPAIAGVTKIYSTHEEFVEKCINGGAEHADGTETTPWEQAQYTAWQVEKKLEVWEDIFGDYGSLSMAGNGNLIQSAVAVHKYLRENEFEYAQAGINVPNENGSTIDCSSYVTWVLINAGVSGFDAGMYQWTSYVFMANPYGWEVISQDNVQPGDILVYSNHVEMYAGQENGQLLVYNCGGTYSIMSDGVGGLEEASYSGRDLSSALILRVPGF